MSVSLLHVHDLFAGYGHRDVLAGVSLTVDKGQWFSLLGPNGSGKSTLLYCISGQLAPRSGSVRIGGESMVASPRLAKRLLGYAHPPDRLPGLLTGRQCLEIYASAKGLSAIDEDVLELAGSFRLDGQLDRFVDTYSVGTRQKLSVLLALIGSPALILLDEAFNSLDPHSALVLKRALRERVRAGQCAVLLATHALDVVLQYADRAGLMLEGKLERTWSQAQMEALREAGPAALEAAFAEEANLSSAIE